MTPGAFVGAVLVVLATMMPAHARTEAIGGGPSHRGASRPPVDSTALSDGGSSSAKTDAAVGPGGAIYTPFAEVPESSGSQAAAATRSSKSEAPDLSLTVIAALAGVAVFGYILRRAMDAH
ncbi:hypothetical protein AB4Z46_04930 [Variovorax sp. M-6]|uniref:hypothetical protein n=1 Tax=Variovorax sp. M-6 TaxID=3233041 RepID=UPI003F95FC3A